MVCDIAFETSLDPDVLNIILWNRADPISLLLLSFTCRSLHRMITPRISKLDCNDIVRFLGGNGYFDCLKWAVESRLVVSSPELIYQGIFSENNVVLLNFLLTPKFEAFLPKRNPRAITLVDPVPNPIAYCGPLPTPDQISFFRLDSLRYLESSISPFFSVFTNLGGWASSKGHMEILRFCRDRCGSQWPNCDVVFVKSVLSGDVQLMSWIYHYFFSPDYLTADTKARLKSRALDEIGQHLASPSQVMTIIGKVVDLLSPGASVIDAFFETAKYSFSAANDQLGIALISAIQNDTYVRPLFFHALANMRVRVAEHMLNSIPALKNRLILNLSVLQAMFLAVRNRPDLLDKAKETVAFIVSNGISFGSAIARASRFATTQDPVLKVFLSYAPLGPRAFQRTFCTAVSRAHYFKGSVTLSVDRLCKGATVSELNTTALVKELRSKGLAALFLKPLIGYNRTTITYDMVTVVDINSLYEQLERNVVQEKLSGLSYYLDTGSVITESLLIEILQLFYAEYLLNSSYPYDPWNELPARLYRALVRLETLKLLNSRIIKDFPKVFDSRQFGALLFCYPSLELAGFLLVNNYFFGKKFWRRMENACGRKNPRHALFRVLKEFIEAYERSKYSPR